jgi:hypothetical protein
MRPPCAVFGSENGAVTRRYPKATHVKYVRHGPSCAAFRSENGAQNTKTNKTEVRRPMVRRTAQIMHFVDVLGATAELIITRGCRRVDQTTKTTKPAPAADMSAVALDFVVCCVLRAVFFVLKLCCC